MPWTKVPKSHADLLERMMQSIPEAELRPMFGCPAYFLNGHMFAGAHQNEVILRLSPAHREEILQCEDVLTFTPMPGRTDEGICRAAAGILHRGK